MIQSMSRVEKCIDNGPMEGFGGPSDELYDESFKLFVRTVKEIIMDL